MTDEEVAADRAVIARATSGPWVFDRLTNFVWGDHPSRLALMEWASDGEFVAAAKERWPAALAEVERLRAENERLRQAAFLRGPRLIRQAATVEQASREETTDG